MTFIKEPSKQIPIKMGVDVAVCGGGPAGLGAAISAARSGAKTVLIERHGFLGGMGTAAMVSSFAYGYHDKKRFIIGGLFQEIREELYRRNALIKTKRNGWEPFNPEEYKILAFELAKDAGITVLCHTWIADVITEKDEINAVIIENKSGRQAIIAKRYIDCTGDGDVAACAGVPYVIGREEDHATQPMTLMYTVSGVDIHKTGEYLKSKGRRGIWKTEDQKDYLNATGFADEIEQAKSDGYLPTILRDHVSALFTVPWHEHIIGVNFSRIGGLNSLNDEEFTQAEIIGRAQAKEGIDFFRKYIPGFENAQLLATGSQIGVRDTRRIKGEYELNEEDILENRQFPDVIAQSCYMIDVHLPDSEKTHIVKLPPGTHYDVPYRSLLPKKINNLIMAGRCISATHNALGSFRVQAICLAIGEAAGTAAALSIYEECAPRNLNIELLQNKLTANGGILN